MPMLPQCMQSVLFLALCIFPVLVSSVFAIQRAAARMHLVAGAVHTKGQAGGMDHFSSQTSNWLARCQLLQFTQTLAGIH